MSLILRFTIVLSLALHAALAAFFIATRASRPSSAKKGIISVDFIQSVPEHEEAIENPSKDPSAAKAKQRAPIPQAIGDPEAAEQESSLYIMAVTKLISERKVYPLAAIDREEEGRVVVGVSLNRQGQVIGKKIEEPSPFSLLNQAALDTISAVGKFPPLPAGVVAPMHLHIPMIFKIQAP
jgi:TonB family protein